MGMLFAYEALLYMALFMFVYRKDGGARFYSFFFYAVELCILLLIQIYNSSDPMLWFGAGLAFGMACCCYLVSLGMCKL